MDVILIVAGLLILVIIGVFIWYKIRPSKTQPRLDEVRPENPQRVGPGLATPQASGARLEIAQGTHAGSVIPLAEEFSIGRAHENHLQLSDSRVSRHHARIRYAQGSWFLQDHDSSGGTFVNGQRVPAARLNPGDKIQIGDTVLIFSGPTPVTPRPSVRPDAVNEAAPLPKRPIMLKQPGVWIAAVCVIAVLAVSLAFLKKPSPSILASVPSNTATLQPTLTQSATFTSAPEATATSRPVPAVTATAACYRWDEVTANMSGQFVCMYGIIRDISYSRKIATRYQFSSQPNTFFLYSTHYQYYVPSTGKYLSPGTCITITGKVQTIQGAPYIDIESGTDFQFRDISSCQ